VARTPSSISLTPVQAGNAQLAECVTEAVRLGLVVWLLRPADLDPSNLGILQEDLLESNQIVFLHVG